MSTSMMPGTPPITPPPGETGVITWPPLTSLWAVLGQGFRLYLACFSTILALTLLIMPLPVFTVHYVYAKYITPNCSEVQVLLINLLVAPTFHFIFSSLLAATTYHVLLIRARTGRSPAMGHALSVGRRKWGWMFLYDSICYLMVMLGMVFCLVPGIYLGIRYALYGPVVACEEPAHAALHRSAQMSASRWWQIFTPGLIVSIPYFLLGLGLNHACKALGEHLNTGNSWCFTAAGALLTVIIGGVLTATTFSIYLAITQGAAIPAQGAALPPPPPYAEHNAMPIEPPVESFSASPLPPSTSEPEK